MNRISSQHQVTQTIQVLSGPPADTPGPLSLSIMLSETGGITLSWEGGTAPFTVESNTSMDEAGWVPEPSTSEREMTMPINTPGQNFFRVRDSD